MHGYPVRVASGLLISNYIITKGYTLMTNAVYKSYRVCKYKVTEALELIAMKDYYDDMSDCFHYHWDRLIISKDYQKQTLRDRQSLTSIYQYCYEQMTNKIVMPIIWEGKLYRTWREYPQSAKDWVYSSGGAYLPRLCMTKESFESDKNHDVAIARELAKKTT